MNHAGTDNRAGWSRAWLAPLALASTLMTASPAWAEEAPVSPELDELEITLEVFDDSAELEAFELRLTEIPATDDDEAMASLTDRMERFDAEASEELEEREFERRRAEEREQEEALEAAIAARHENERLAEIAAFDSADELDELDLQPEFEEMPEEDGMYDEWHDEHKNDDLAADESSDAMDDEPTDGMDDDLDT